MASACFHTPSSLPGEFMEIRSAQHTHVGMQRRENQDAMGAFNGFHGSLFVVADGMGGYAGGRLASHTAMAAIGDAFQQADATEPESELLERLIRRANDAILTRGIASPELLGMGTTCVLVLITRDGNRAHYAHVGDSRIYLFPDVVMRQLTKDHTTVQRLVDKGVITAEQAPLHPQAGVITRSVGVAPELDIDIHPDPIALQNNDVILLCSDGLTTMLGDEAIARYLEEVPYNEVGRELIGLANARGGYDNITLALIQVGECLVTLGPTMSGLVRLSDLIEEEKRATKEAFLAGTRSQRRILLFLMTLLVLLAGLIVWAW